MRTALSTSLVLIALHLTSAMLLLGSGLEVTQRSMVVTLDDLPAQRVQALPIERVQTITSALLDTLGRHEIPAVGFVNEDKLFKEDDLDPDRVALLESWLQAGIELGNHSFSHRDLHRVPLAEFQSDVLQGDRITRPLATARQIPYRYFRHPYLHTGLDLGTKKSIENFLDQNGYRIAPVTIDNSEWIFAQAYEETLNRGEEDLQQKLGREYVDYMLRMVDYYESQALGLFDRQIPQILLVHANALNADYLGVLLEALERRGYRFIHLDLALTDPAFDSADTYVGPGGITWLHRWALTRGVEGSFFRGEPLTAQWVQDLAGIEE